MSITATFLPFAIRDAAVIAILFIKQNHIERSDVAWCPGGRIAQNAVSASVWVYASTAERPDPAAKRAAPHEPALIAVSGSMRPPPSASKASKA